MATCVLILLIGTSLTSLLPLSFTQVGTAALIIGGIVGATFALAWTLATVRRPWRDADVERGHRHALDLLDREIQNGIVASQSEPPQPTYPSPERLSAVVLSILKRHFAGEKTTREACVKAGTCTQPEWNTVNAILLKSGLKKGYRIRADSMADTWRAWKERVKFDHDRAWVKQGGRGSWVAVEFEQQ
jgi:hypothetical protein